MDKRGLEAEKIFMWPGNSTLIADALKNRDIDEIIATADKAILHSYFGEEESVELINSLSHEFEGNI